MHMRKPLGLGLCAIAAVVAPVAAAIQPPTWDIVPDRTLADLRGGVDLGTGDLVGYFAIDRVIEVNGAVIARMQIVITHLDRLDSGGLPTVSVSGPLGQLVQVLNAQGPAGLTATSSDAPAVAAATPAPVTASPAPTTPSPAAAAPSAPVAAPAPTSAVVAAASPTSGSMAAAPITSGSISPSNTQSGSLSQFGSALATAVSAANGSTGGSSGGGTSNSAAATPAQPTPAQPALAQPTLAQTSSPTALASASGAAGSTTVTQVIPAAAGPQIVLTGLPNASALTAAVQNQVKAAVIQTQTTITATVNSLTSFNALSLGNAIRTQVAGSH